MAIAENTPRRLVLKSGSRTLTFDRESDQATLQRKFLFWNLRPAQTPLSEIADVTNDVAIDRASGVEVWQTMLVMRTEKPGHSQLRTSRILRRTQPLCANFWSYQLNPSSYRGIHSAPIRGFIAWSPVTLLHIPGATPDQGAKRR
jgi:hypothetical protein